MSITNIKNITLGNRPIKSIYRGGDLVYNIKNQVINYRLIYYLGNEFASPTDEEKKYAIATGGWNVSNANTSSSYRGIYSASAGYRTEYNIDTQGFDKVFSYVVGSGHKNIYNVRVIATGYNNIAVGTNIDTFYTNPYYYVSRYDNPAERLFVIGNLNNLSAPVLVAVGSTANVGVSSTAILYMNNAKNSNHLYERVYWDQRNMNNVASIYASGFVKTDDISGLSNYGSTISEILSNATSLFNDPSALEWMVLNCTGDFMISALANSNFVSAMNASPNKTILTENEHWARFIALLSV